MVAHQTLVQSNPETNQSVEATRKRSAELRSTASMVSAAVKTPLSVRFVFFAMFIAFVAATLAGMPLLYDGGNYLVHVLNYSLPCTPYYRNALALFHYPTIWTAQLTGQLEPAALVFNSLFSLGPLLAVGLAWLTVRAAKPGLFVWAMIGIALTGIFAQPYRIGENLLVCELAWPLLLGVLVPINARRGAVVVALGLWMANLHPVSSMFLIGVAAVAVLQAVFAKNNGNREEARIFLNVASILILIAVIRMTVAPPHASNYEAKELSTARLSEHFEAIKILGFSSLALLASCLDFSC